MPAPGIDPLRRGITRFNTWVEPCEPLTYRDAWRYGVLFPGLLLPQAGAHFVLGNAIWSALLALIVPAMAAFTFGFAVREGTARQRAVSLGVGVLGTAAPAVSGSVRRTVVAVGPAGVVLVWLLVLLGLFGYAFPEYGPAVFDSHSDGNSARSES